VVAGKVAFLARIVRSKGRLGEVLMKQLGRLGLGIRATLVSIIVSVNMSRIIYASSFTPPKKTGLAKNWNALLL
jgi:hypothetical protein